MVEMGLNLLLLLVVFCLDAGASQPPSESQCDMETLDEAAHEPLIRSSIDFNWRTSRQAYALYVTGPDSTGPEASVVCELRQMGFRVMAGSASEFPIDARAKLRKGVDAVLMNHDGLHVKALSSLVFNDESRKMLKGYAADSTRRRNERLILRIRHNLQILGMADASKGAVERALGELGEYSTNENLPNLDKIVEKVYLERQSVIMHIKATSTSQPGMRTVRVPSGAAGSATIEIPEVTLQSLRSTTMVPVR